MSAYAGYSRRTWAAHSPHRAAESRAAWATLTASQRLGLRIEYRHLRHYASAVIAAGSMRRNVRTLGAVA